MRTRFSDPRPEDAETFEGELFWKKSDLGGTPVIKMWKKKSQKPYAFYKFRNEEHRQEYLNREIESIKQRREQISKRKTEESEKVTLMRNQIQVGDIFSYSWGYDQTNVEFFQVTEVSKTRKSVTVREIQSKLIPNEGKGTMSGYCQPVKDFFIGEPLKKTIKPYGISFQFGNGTLTTPESKHYTSWYA